MLISNHISLPIFLASFSIGLFFIYVIGPEKKTIFVYPTPENYANTQYKDISNQCFKYKPIETQCPMNPFSIKTIPMQK